MNEKGLRVWLKPLKVVLSYNIRKLGSLQKYLVNLKNTHFCFNSNYFQKGTFFMTWIPFVII